MSDEGDLKKELIAKTMGLKKEPGQSISDVQKAAEDMTVIDRTMETARKLAGTDTLSQQLDRKDQKMEELQKEKEKKEQELQKTQLQLIESELGSKIEHLSDLVKGGASPKSIGQQIAEIKGAAADLGLSGSKVSEFKEIANLIQALNPHKGLAEQIKEAQDLIAIIQPPHKEGTLEGIPVSVAIELKKLDHDLQIRLEEMKDQREERAERFQLEVRKWEEDRETRREEVDGKILVERERNAMLGGALRTIGGGIGQGIKHGVAGQPGAINQASGQGKSYHVTIGEGDYGQTPCPNCQTPVGIGPTSTEGECVQCHAHFRINRTPKDTAQADPGQTASAVAQEDE